ncbi:uncharacterized protein LOC108601655 [Drosophila busckii]|uniref:uncharacterized protein LOC108601655 n=1 Tax=Drosophila busckii TaxID=30019 RepID=UPI00083EF6F9|nr:uncharacterized protein LOC108601655 [Drosophila busckii]
MRALSRIKFLALVIGLLLMPDYIASQNDVMPLDKKNENNNFEQQQQDLPPPTPQSDNLDIDLRSGPNDIDLRSGPNDIDLRSRSPQSDNSQRINYKLTQYQSQTQTVPGSLFMPEVLDHNINNKGQHDQHDLREHIINHNGFLGQATTDEKLKLLDMLMLNNAQHPSLNGNANLAKILLQSGVDRSDRLGVNKEAELQLLDNILNSMKPADGSQNMVADVLKKDIHTIIEIMHSSEKPKNGMDEILDILNQKKQPSLTPKNEVDEILDILKQKKQPSLTPKNEVDEILDILKQKKQPSLTPKNEVEEILEILKQKKQPSLRDLLAPAKPKNELHDILQGLLEAKKQKNDNNDELSDDTRDMLDNLLNDGKPTLPSRPKREPELDTDLRDVLERLLNTKLGPSPQLGSIALLNKPNIAQPLILPPPGLHDLLEKINQPNKIKDELYKVMDGLGFDIKPRYDFQSILDLINDPKKSKLELGVTLKEIVFTIRDKNTLRELLSRIMQTHKPKEDVVEILKDLLNPKAIVIQKNETCSICELFKNSKLLLVVQPPAVAPTPTPAPIPPTTAPKKLDPPTATTTLEVNPTTASVTTPELISTTSAAKVTHCIDCP